MPKKTVAYNKMFYLKLVPASLLLLLSSVCLRLGRVQGQVGEVGDSIYDDCGFIKNCLGCGGDCSGGLEREQQCIEDKV